ncbi:hypothetical protein BKP35_16410 [Anaerobacillus arseniciselenatis]|uniref:Uncharacterized protein n=1 Tax=Anaerobacillus arseniciselenatis TaxID=85682 RepID=A0A1S2LAR6_9BACI|nr:hypothetical protein [Anaerobacillus arseniciselenatis]OIJ09436.1 hypothetical protein BKP35_16410 [Anaerobacillus arseniciselenatis]
MLTKEQIKQLRVKTPTPIKLSFIPILVSMGYIGVFILLTQYVSNVTISVLSFLARRPPLQGDCE